MKTKTRYEIEFRVGCDGSARVTIYDDYMDTVERLTLIDRRGVPNQEAIRYLRQTFPCLNPQEVELFAWFAIHVADYPFGPAVEAERIPGRNRVYA